MVDVPTSAATARTLTWSGPPSASRRAVAAMRAERVSAVAAAASLIVDSLAQQRYGRPTTLLWEAHMAVQTTNPYLEGAFAPVEEEVTVADLAVVGSLPPELDGRYLRIGPNPMRQNVPDPARHHWFVGDGMVHGLRL